MPDRESVITHLQIMHTWASFAREHDLQFFTAKHLEDIAQWSDDALALLKEQEGKEAMVVESANLYTGLPISRCPKCGVKLDRFLYGRQYEGEINYCPFCGQAIKWE